jgi:GntR family transcriptional regulator
MSNNLHEGPAVNEEFDWDLGSWPGRRSSLPAEIAVTLALRIRSGEVRPGSRLPSEPELARVLGVSRNSVREAISVLREQGLVATKQGIGTFVLDPSQDAYFPVDVGIEQLMSTTELITRAGHKAGSRDYRLITGRADPMVRQQLRLDKDEQVHCLERVRTADGMSVILCRDYLSVSVLPTRLVAQYRGDESLFLFLQRECRFEVKTARADIVPVLPSSRVAELLQVSRRKPLLVLNQLHYDGEGNPFLYSENHFNLEYMGLHVRRTPVI